MNKDIIYDQSMSLNWILLTINFSIFICVLIGSIILLWKLKLETKGYKLLFIFYTLFWFPLMLVRSYRGTLNNDLEIDKSLLWVPLTVYGLIGIIARPIFDFFGAYFKSRKSIVYFSLWLQIISFIPVILHPSFTTNIIQSIGVGIGASCIGTFSLWFNEQHTKTKPFLTISILSLPPLIADFLASPIQSIIRSLSKYGSSNPNEIPIHADPHVTIYLWIIALCFILINCIVGYFLKEQRSFIGIKKEQNKKIINTKLDILILIFIILVGASIDFAKFSTSDSIATLIIQSIGGSQNTKTFEGYISALFSFFQLLGGILMGLIFSRYFTKIIIYIFGIFFLILYNTSTILITQYNSNSIQGAILFLSIQSLNGFGYGILYNLLIAHVLSLGFKAKYFSPLGIYQSFAAASIASGTFFTSALKSFLKNVSWDKVVLIVGFTLVSLLIFMTIIYYLANYISCGFKNKMVWKMNFNNNIDSIK